MMAKMLLEIETIDAKDIEYIMTHDENSSTTVDSLI
jgi:ATP-dependent Zn protease